MIALLRRERLTGWQIAEQLGMPLSTVSTILARIGLGRLSRLEPSEPPNRYQRERPGELVHVDVKKLGRIGRPRSPCQRRPPHPLARDRLGVRARRR